jgi:outer membrane protein, heavy metal efflux system
MTMRAQIIRRETLGIRPRRRAPAALAARAGTWILAVLAPGACTLYRPLPLEDRAALPLAELQVPAGTLLPGGLHSHVFDPSDGLDATEVAMLAVVHGPELKVLRAQANVTRAQAFAAGLLPDPVIGVSQDKPDAGQSGASTAFVKGVSWDVASLVTYASRQTARRRSDEQVDLSLLWAEWQTIAESRLQFVRIQYGRELVARLEAESAALAPLAPHLSAALKRGEITFEVATTGLSAASDVARQLTEARDALANQEQDLRVLLGLPPAEVLWLVGGVDVPPIDRAAADAALEALPQRRPDLRALGLGYAAEEARVRTAVLGQFPAVNFGVNRSQDNAGIASSGFALSVSLPLFDANRGAIHLEHATREQLHAEYAQRLLTARAEVARLLSTQELLAAREAGLAPYAATLATTTARAAKAYERGAMDWTVYLGLRQSALAAAVELISLRATLAEARIGLATLLSGDWPEPTGAAEGAAT